MEKLRKGDHNRTLRNEAHSSFVSRDESDTTRNRLCRRLVQFLGGKKTKRQTQNVTPPPVGVLENKPGVVSSEKDDPMSEYNLELNIGGEILQNSQQKLEEFVPGCPEADDGWEREGNCGLVAQISPEKKSAPELKVSSDSDKSSETSSTSAVIVVDDSKCDTSWKPPGFQTGLERISSLLNSFNEDEVSVGSEHTSSRNSGNVKELIPSGSTTAEDLAEVLAAHIARERQASAALSFSSCIAKEITEWRRELSLRTDSTESLLGWLNGPSASLKCTDDSNLASSRHGSACFASNINLSKSVLPEDEMEEQEFEPDELIEEDIIEEDEEGAVMVEPNDTLFENVASLATLKASMGTLSRTKYRESNVVDAATSVQSTSVSPKVEVSTTTTPRVSHLKAADVTHIDELGYPSKKNEVHVKWGGGWMSSSNKENLTSKTPNGVSSMSIPSPSGRTSSPGFPLSTMDPWDTLSTLTFSEELDLHSCPILGHKDTEDVQKLTQLLEELSADEQPWVRVSVAYRFCSQ